MKVLMLLSVLVCLASSKAVRDPALDAYLRAILESLKEQMPVGIPELGIPPLDPFDVPHFDIPHIEEDIIKVDIEINDLVIINLSTFNVETVHLDLEHLGLNLDLSIPDLRGDANYKLDGSILGLLPLYGEGAMFLELFNLFLHANASVLIDAEGFVQITTMDLSADFSEIKIHLDDLLGGGEFGESINNMLNLLGGFIWDQLKDVLFPLLDSVLKDVLNDALHGCNIADLIQNGECLRQKMAAIGIKA
jgi:hypothetical protein